MTFQEWLPAAGGVTSLLMLGMYLVYKGTMSFRAQVDREIAAIVKGYEDIIAMYKQQLDEERDDKNAWKDAARGGIPVMSKAVEGVVEAVKKAGP